MKRTGFLVILMLGIGIYYFVSCQNRKNETQIPNMPGENLFRMALSQNYGFMRYSVKMAHPTNKMKWI